MDKPVDAMVTLVDGPATALRDVTSAKCLEYYVVIHHQDGIYVTTRENVRDIAITGEVKFQWV